MALPITSPTAADNIGKKKVKRRQHKNYRFNFATKPCTPCIFCEVLEKMVGGQENLHQMFQPFQRATVLTPATMLGGEFLFFRRPSTLEWEDHSVGC